MQGTDWRMLLARRTPRPLLRLWFFALRWKWTIGAVLFAAVMLLLSVTVMRPYLDLSCYRKLYCR